MNFGGIGKLREDFPERSTYRWWSVLTSPLYSILTVLKKIEYHLSIASDTELKDQDVDK